MGSAGTTPVAAGDPAVKGTDKMTKNRVRATIAAGVVVAGLLTGAGVVYATSDGGCGPSPSLSKAVGPNGTTSADTTAVDGPLCVAPVAPVAPVSR
jgi:hypothetical protein